MISISVMMVLVHDVAREGNHDNIDIYWFTNQFNWSKKKIFLFLKMSLVQKQKQKRSQKINIAQENE